MWHQLSPITRADVDNNIVYLVGAMLLDLDDLLAHPWNG